jgi:hypothetical protein
LTGRTNTTTAEKCENMSHLKKGERTNCENYREISLLDVIVTYKVLTRLIRNRISLFHDTLLGEYQGGFRKGSSSTAQIFTLRVLQKQSFKQNLSLHIFFIGFKKLYDCT